MDRKYKTIVMEDLEGHRAGSRHESGTIIPHRGFRTPDGRGGRFDTPKFWRRTGGLPQRNAV